MKYRSYNDLNNLIRTNLPLLIAEDFDLIVGIPRSGMVPAYMIALFLNANCTDYYSFLNNYKVTKGKTRDSKNQITYPHDASRILIVDDSLNSGNSIQDAVKLIPEALHNKITTLIVYSSKQSFKGVDIIFEKISSPRFFEWNLFHNRIINNAAIDIDGVLCVDPEEYQNDDSHLYIEFLKSAKPLFIPTKKVKVLVTNRLEKYRKETEMWLEKLGVQYEQLVMLNLPDKETRLKTNANHTHKGEIYKDLDAELFIESHFVQAKSIMKLSGKPVYCVETNQLLSPSALDANIKNPTFHIKQKVNIIKHKTKLILKQLFS